MLEIIAKANNIIQRLKITNDDGNVQILYPSKITRKNMKYKTATGTENINPAYFFTMSREIIEYLSIKQYVYFYEVDKKFFISPVEPEGLYKRVKLNSKRQVLVPKFLNPGGFVAAVVVVDMSEDHPYAGGCGVVRLELI